MIVQMKIVNLIIKLDNMIMTPINRIDLHQIMKINMNKIKIIHHIIIVMINTNILILNKTNKHKNKLKLKEFQ
jgi:hypothetical protein